jgi:alpha-tubulin suppressor-like RCC1 family protein
MAATIDLGRIKFSLQGEWASSTLYSIGDMVIHANKLWVMKRAYVPNSLNNYAPGKKSLGWRDVITKDDIKSRTSYTDYDLINLPGTPGAMSALENATETSEPGVNDEYGFINANPNFNYNYRQFKNLITVKVASTKFQFDGSTAGLANTWIQLLENETYAFEQHDASNLNYALAFSLTAEPSAVSLAATGYVRYFLNTVEVSEATYFASFLTSSIFNKQNHRRVELTVPIGATAIYPYCPATSGLFTGGVSIPVTKSWEGYLYWDEISTKVNFRGEWNPTTQYFHNDLVTYKSYQNHALFTTPSPNRYQTVGKDIYRCTVDNLNSPPVIGAMDKTRSPLMTSATNTSGRLSTNVNSRQTKWENFSGDGDNQAAAWFPNQGPIGWAYKHHHNQGANIYANQKYIDKNGTVWTRGQGTSGDIANGDGNIISYFQEICFKFRDWDTSEDRNRGGTQNRRGIKYTRHGNVPKCIQIEQGYSYTLYLFDNGEVKHSGYGANGEGGLGNYNSYNQPVNVNGLEDVRIIKVATNISQEQQSHTCLALSDKGDVYAWGYNGYGQLAMGRLENWAAARKIPRNYFDNKKIIDIAITGNAESVCFARTADDWMYGWGRNNSGVLATGDTTDRYRPFKMTGWDPVANNGIKVFQCVNYSNTACAFILDGNGYIWRSGHNGYGQGFAANQTSVTTWTISTTAPGGSIVDMWCCHWNSYTTLFARKNDGTTWVAGYSGSQYLAGNNSTSTAIFPPVQLNARLNNLKEVHILGTQSDTGIAYYLMDNGMFLTQGYNGSGSSSNPLAGSPWNGQDGTYIPYHTYIPAGTRIQSITGQGLYRYSAIVSPNYFGMISFCSTENGQIFGWGYSDNYTLGHSTWNNNSNNGGIMCNGGQGR